MAGKRAAPCFETRFQRLLSMKVGVFAGANQAQRATA